MNAYDLFKAIHELDLGPIRIKLMHTGSGEGWSQQKADAAEKEYRRFLCLMKLYPQEQIAPPAEVDIFWHYHILDTRKYAADCEQVFGYFLHHHPYLGMGDEDDRQCRIDSGKRMRALYHATFGEPLPGADCDAAIQAHTAFCAGPDHVPSRRPGIRTGALPCPRGST